MKRLTIFLLFIFVLVACAPGAEPQAEAPRETGGEVAQNDNADSEVTTADQPVTESTAPRVTEEDAPEAQPVEAELPVAQEEPPVGEEAIEEPGAESAPPDSEPQELPAPEEETAASPTEEPPVAEAPEATGPVIVSGRIEEGAFFLGDVNAPVTVIDYSDFL